MKLNVITIVDDNKCMNNRSKKCMPLNLEMHYVMEIYKHFLKKIEFDGSKKLSIHFDINAKKVIQKIQNFIFLPIM